MRNATIEQAYRRCRTNAPAALRFAYRLARSFLPIIGSRSIPADLLEQCRFSASRYDMLAMLPRAGRVAEMGTYKGDFARQILIRNLPTELHVIDIDYSRFDKCLLSDGRVHSHLGWAHEVIASFEDNFFDWVYVDAEHSYEATLRDALAAAPKIKPGGFLVFNDFAHIDMGLGRYGVHRAVAEFMNDRRWPMRFFAFDTCALYDVALQKPL